jgi:hypothetical protein
MLAGALLHNQDCLFQWYLWWCTTDGMGKQIKFSVNFYYWFRYGEGSIFLTFFVFWFRILVPDYGFMHLELIPMLVGFFTYKIATFAQAIQDSIPAVGNREVWTVPWWMEDADCYPNPLREDWSVVTQTVRY